MDRSCTQSSTRPPGLVLPHRIAGRLQRISWPPGFHPVQDKNAALGHWIILLVLDPFSLAGAILRWNSKSRIKWNVGRNLAIGFATQDTGYTHITALKACFGNNSHVAKGILLLLKHEVFCYQDFFSPKEWTEILHNFKHINILWAPKSKLHFTSLLYLKKWIMNTHAAW